MNKQVIPINLTGKQEILCYVTSLEMSTILCWRLMQWNRTQLACVPQKKYIYVL